MSTADFLLFASQHGLIIDHFIADGRIHRCRTVDHPRQKKNGAYQFDGTFGWTQAWDRDLHPILFRDTKNPFPSKERLQETRRELQQKHLDAAKEAKQILDRCTMQVHPYLAAKGFPKEFGLVDTDGRLVVPMRDCRHYRGQINSVQWIADNGWKQFLPGGVAKGSIYSIGSGEEAWYVEGYATGLSVRCGLKRLYRKDRVVICFSASNLEYVACLPSFKNGLSASVKRIVADNDANGVGERVAASTGLPWAMPEELGDANDLHVRHGVETVAEMLREIL